MLSHDKQRTTGDNTITKMIDRLLPIPNLTVSDLMRFWSKVSRKGKSECWDWLAVKVNGYGRFRINNNKYSAHRISYFIHYGDDPGRLLTCHTCNNPSCVNPYHLFLGNQSENIQQSIVENRRHSKGILHPCAKLQESDIKEIRNMQGKLNGVELGKIFNVSATTIYGIWSGRSWSHIA